MYLDKIVLVERLTPTNADSDKEQYQTVGNYTNVKMNIQPASAELTAVSEGVFGRTYQAFATVSGMRIGDRVTVSGTNDIFIIKGIQDYYWGPIPHVEIVLFRSDN